MSMSDVIEAAVGLLAAKVKDGFDGVAVFVIPGEGSIVIDGAGVRAGSDDDAAGADVTMTATSEVFQAILAGDLSPTSAFMTGKLSIDGSMGMAMKVGSALS
jgi:putative sterol carrier protein